MKTTNEKNTMCGSEKDKLVERAWKALVDTGMSEEEIMDFVKICQKVYDKGIRLENIAISLEAPLETNLKISEDQKYRRKVERTFAWLSFALLCIVAFAVFRFITQ